jgi:iron(III) transport system ATP-binding protein
MMQTSSSAAALAMPVCPPDAADAGERFLSVRSIDKRFGAFTALDSVSLEVRQGEMVCLLGPSGCGKTTLLRTIAGLERQDAGQLFAAGRDISDLPPQSRDYGILFQSYALFPNLTVADNVAYGLRNMKRQARQERVTEMLSMVGLAGSQAKYPGQLSGGQQQRVALARALAPSPSLLLLDEPLSALDAQVREHLQLEIRRLQKQFRITTLMVTHDQEEAMVMADRIAVMQHGRIEQFGTPAEIYRRPATPFVADFIGQANWLPFPASLVHRSRSVPCVWKSVRKKRSCKPGACSAARKRWNCSLPRAAPTASRRVVDRIYLGNRYRLALAADALPGQTLLADVSDQSHERLAALPAHDGLWVALPRQALQVA